ncbi:DUF3179 domain-containing protein [Pseudomonadales bacterium]|nr:DUF3179 domain-containing protein [Pseudomonadales bacterium]
MTETMTETLIWQFLYWTLMAIATFTSFRYFRDLGDITQAFMKVTRKNMLFAIRYEHQIIVVSLVAVGAATWIGYRFAVGWGSSTTILLTVNLFFIGFPYLWVHFGLRNQQASATYYSIDEARNFVRPEDSVIVLVNNGQARAHPDYHIKRPHLAGTPEGLGGDDIIMTYCCLTHLGLGYKPEIDGKHQELTVVAQHGNNLIMRDSEQGEPIQQMYGSREKDGRNAANAMTQWPTFRMTFRGFQKAYPQGTVFLNKIKPFGKNPLLFLWDHIVEVVFLWGTISHHTNESLLFATMDVEDDRLRMKDLVWGFNVDQDSVAYTEEYVRQQGGLINTNVGNRNIVIAWDQVHESLGIFYNDTGAPVASINFWGEVDGKQLLRVETVKAGAYWFVWVNYFPETDVNRETQLTLAQAS